MGHVPYHGGLRRVRPMGVPERASLRPGLPHASPHAALRTEGRQPWNGPLSTLPAREGHLLPRLAGGVRAIRRRCLRPPDQVSAGCHRSVLLRARSGAHGRAPGTRASCVDRNRSPQLHSSSPRPAQDGAVPSFVSPRSSVLHLELLPLTLAVRQDPDTSPWLQCACPPPLARGREPYRRSTPSRGVEATETASPQPRLAAASP